MKTKGTLGIKKIKDKVKLQEAELKITELPDNLQEKVSGGCCDVNCPDDSEVGE